MSDHAIALQLLDRGPRATRAIAEFLNCLGDGAEATKPAADGTFEVKMSCADQDAALQKVWDALAACGGDDHLVIMEHPDIARHWEHRAERPTG